MSIRSIGAVILVVAACEPDINLRFTTISVGGMNACGMVATGETYCWGNNENGQVGNEDTTKVPARYRRLVTVDGQPLILSQVSAPLGWYVCGLTATGAAHCWGLNAYGSLGIGTTVGPRDCSPGFSCSATPQPVVGGLTFTTLSSWGFSCGLTSSAALYCWGLNNLGQIVAGGVAHGINSPTPVLLAGMPSFVALAVGTGHGCGLLADHTAWCWGHNGSGVLGDSSFTYSATAVRVAGGLTFNMLSAGMSHTCGITPTGAAWCWGSYGRGRLGDNNTAVDRFAPVAVHGGLTFATISAGWEHTCGLTTSGAAYCWGANDHGQLGDGSTTDRATPVAVASGSNFTAIRGGQLAHVRSQGGRCGVLLGRQHLRSTRQQLQPGEHGTSTDSAVKSPAWAPRRSRR